MTPEQWLPVVGYEGYYEVSDQGRVRSVTRTDWHPGRTEWRPSSGGWRTRKGRVLKLNTSGNYPKVELSRDGVEQTRRVHRLVAEAFIGPCPEGLEVCHDNGDHHDNRLENLRYDTHSANQMDTVRYGGHSLAKRTHCNNDHEYTAENTTTDGGKRRRCRTCERARSVRRWKETLDARASH